MIRDRFGTALKELLSDDKWLILQDSYEEKDNLSNESLFCLTNGYMGTRGSFEEGTKRSLPYTYINGIFDKSETFMRELAALPDWTRIRLYVEKQPVGIEDCRILEFARVLDMKQASVARRAVLEDGKGRRTLIEGIRFLSRANVHRMGIRLWVTPLNYSGIIEVENIIDGTIYNFYDAPRFKVKHTYLVENGRLDAGPQDGEDGVQQGWEGGVPQDGDNGVPLAGEQAGADAKGAYIEVATRDDGIKIGIGCLLECLQDGKPASKARQFGAFGEQAVEFTDFDACEGQATEIVKYAAAYTEKDCPGASLRQLVGQEARGFMEDGFGSEFEAHCRAYDAMWQDADIRIEGDDEVDKGVRFNVFHLMSTANEHSDRVNVGAKLLHGEEYGGHAFWDTELFMMPFFAWTFPATARNLENYRYHLLDAARANAKKNGYRGAQYPWESADDGSEQCPDWTIEPDGTCYRCYVAVYEHHVTAAVAYGIYNYVKITGDKEFLYNQGAEILVETARFWNSRCEYNGAEGRYEIRKVTGPDEWHEPVDNNLYTNYLARWNLNFVRELLADLKENQRSVYMSLVGKTGLEEAELEDWREHAEKLYLPRKENSRLLEQFEGYFDLLDVTIEKYDDKDWPIKPEILKTVDKSKTQVIKQADVVMLLHLMGEEFDAETQKENYAYYKKRALHGSSLSPSIYAIMGLKVGDASKAYRYLRRAALLDLLNLQKNTREGIHAANAGGVWQTVVFGFAGLSKHEDGTLHLKPQLPEEWKSLTFRVRQGASWLEISIDGENRAEVRVLDGEPVEITVEGVSDL